jgi:serine protease Do
MKSLLSSRFARGSSLGAAGILALALAAMGAAQPKTGQQSALTLKHDTTPVTRSLMEASSFSDVVKRVSPSVVKITVEMRARNVVMNGPDGQFPGMDNPFFRQFFGNRAPQMQQPESSGLGSGVIISKDGYIVTNNHVVADAKTVKVTLADGRELSARVIGRDPQTDVAVIKIDAKDLPAITFASSNKTEVGDRVLAIGNPFGIGETVTTGIISAKERRAGLGLRYEDFIQTDAAINPGNSGGALVDVEGRLVGMNTAILSRSGGFQGVGLAVPADLVGSVVDNLVAHGKVVRGYLGIGIQDLTPTLAESFGLKTTTGALVSDVQPDSPAAKAGIKSGDVVTTLNGEPVDNASRLSLTVGQTPPGTQLALDVLRDGSTRHFDITTAKKPAGDRNDTNGDDDSSVSGDDQGVLNGVAVNDIDDSLRQQMNLPERLHGAVITKVEPSSASARAGIREGDVILEINHHKVANSKDAVSLSEHAANKRTLVKLWSHGNTVFVVVDETDSSNNSNGSGPNSNSDNEPNQSP